MTDETTSEIKPLEGPEEKPAKPPLAAVLGKIVTFTNFVLALIFLSIAFFFYSNRVQVSEKKSKLLQKTAELLRKEDERRKVVEDLTQQIELEKQRLVEVTRKGEKDVADLEKETNTIRERVDASRSEQIKLSEDASKLEQQQKALIAEIDTLRATREDTRSEEEALVADRQFILDQLAKTNNDLKQATARSQEIEETISELQRTAGK